jgi:hypothetical protein
MSLIVNAPQGPAFNQNETPTARPLGDLWWQRKANEMSGCNGIEWGGQYGFGQAGYATGGYTGVSATSSVDKLVFSSETIASIATTFGPTPDSMQRGYFSGVLAGYACGCTRGDNTAIGTAHKLVYITEVSSTLASNLSTTRGDSGEGTASSSAGYIVGGMTSLSQRHSTYTDKLIFSTDAISANTSASTQIRCQTGAVEETTKGFICGSVEYSNFTFTTIIDRITFSTDAISSITSGLTTAGSGAGVSSKTNGYLTSVGNNSTMYTTAINRLSFSTESCVLLGVGLVTAFFEARGCSSHSYVSGYIMGGYAAGNYVSTTQRLAFRNEATSILGSSTTVSHAYGQGFEHLN